jgi:hypothetical protein
MAAIPGTQRIISLVLMSVVLAILADSGAIIAWIGQTWGTAVAGIGIVVVLAIREFIKEAGLNAGDLNNQGDVNTLSAQVGALSTQSGAEQPATTDEPKNGGA